jgi:diacylglycerol O-acyltransferase-1
MASQTEAVTTAHEHSSARANGITETEPDLVSVSAPAPTSIGKKRHSKYRHVAAYHAQLRHSSLSRDTDVTPSFLGFRNLMVLVLGRHRCSGSIELACDN